MSLWSQQRQKSDPAVSGSVSGFGLCLVLFLSACPPLLALDSVPGEKAPAPEAAARPTEDKPVGAKSALDAQLDQFQSAIDKNTLTMDEFQKLADVADQNPVNARAHLLFGRALDMQGLVDQAVKQYEIADKYGPKDPEAIAALLHNVLAKGSGEASNSLLNSAIKRFPNNPEILFMIGRRLREKHHDQEAGKAFSQAFKTGKKVPGLASAIGDLVLESQPQRAIAFAKFELADNPNFASALIVLAKAYMMEGHYQLAIEPLTKLYKMSPANDETTQLYLRALYWCGDYKTALMPAFYCMRHDAQWVAADNKTAGSLSRLFTHLPQKYCSETLQKFYEDTDKASLEVGPAFHYYVGTAFFRVHRYGDAKAELLKFYDSDSKSGQALMMLGYIAENYDHDNVLALKYYRMAHALLPLHPVIAANVLSLESRTGEGYNDWAWCLRNWFYTTFSWLRN
jgi:cytochrome c-type biogenesis protein CcmH/NrfG